MTALSVVMIVRDEEARVARALASVSQWVDEMIVVDTGSQDGTVDAALHAGAKVEHFAWCDDFAAARNKSLEVAAAPWRLVLDADEWLESGGEFLCALPKPGSCVGLVSVVDHLLQAGHQQTTVTRVARLLPSTARFTGRIHEQVEPSFVRVDTPVRLGHDGYQPERHLAKVGRNEVLLRAALDKAPRDGYLWLKLGNDLEVQRRYLEALDAYARASAWTKPVDIWAHELAVRHGSCLVRAGRPVDAIHLLEGARRRWSVSPDLPFALGDAFVQLALQRPDTAERSLEVAQRCWKECLVNGDQEDLPGSVLGRGSHLAEANLALVEESLTALRRNRMGQTPSSG